MKIGAQFYTLRDHAKTPEDFERSLDRVAAMGYEGVQLSAVACLDQLEASDVREMLDSRGLICAATHRSWEALSQRTEEELALHHAWGCGYTAIGVPPPGVHEAGIAGFDGWLLEAKPFVERLASEGLTFGYHNHALEFQKFDGVRPIDVLLAADWLPIELDTCWVHAGGLNVVSLIEKLHGRLPVVHVKDRVVYGWDVVDGPVGEGNLDWPEILAAFKEAGTEWLLVEQDNCRRDPFDCLESSLNFLKKLV